MAPRRMGRSRHVRGGNRPLEAPLVMPFLDRRRRRLLPRPFELPPALFIRSRRTTWTSWAPLPKTEPTPGVADFPLLAQEARCPVVLVWFLWPAARRAFSRCFQAPVGLLVRHTGVPPNGTGRESAAGYGDGFAVGADYVGRFRGARRSRTSVQTLSGARPVSFGSSSALIIISRIL